MSELAGKTQVRETSIAAVIVRADGTREDLGVISYWHRRWWRRAWHGMRHGYR